MAKAKLVGDVQGRFYGIKFVCPGCDLQGPGWAGAHVLPVTWTPEDRERSPEADNGKPTWGFNGNLERPTFTPSILSKYSCREGEPEYVCHSFVRDGLIQFLNDCTHALAGQTVDLPDIEAYEAAQAEDSE